MTTKITVEVPLGATYKVEVQYKDYPGAEFLTYTVNAGEKLEFHIWGSKQVTNIREIPI